VTDAQARSLRRYGKANSCRTIDGIAPLKRMRLGLACTDVDRSNCDAVVAVAEALHARGIRYRALAAHKRIERIGHGRLLGGSARKLRPEEMLSDVAAAVPGRVYDRCCRGSTAFVRLIRTLELPYAGLFGAVNTASGRRRSHE
jgi:hypothetical protein